MAESEWWTSPMEAENGQMIMVTGRADVEKFRSNPRFGIRVQIMHKYQALPDGMPAEADAELMEQVVDNMQAVLKKDPVAVLTGIYTGAGQRDLVFYTLSTNIFTKKLNEALANMPLLPLEITAENDADWAEYDEMKELSEIK